MPSSPVHPFFSTPRSATSLAVFLYGLLLCVPFFVVAFYVHNLLLGVYSSGGDNILAPIVAECFYWVIWAPIAAYLIRRHVLKDYPGPVSLFAWNRSRMKWSIGWTLLCLVAAGYPFMNLPRLIALHNWVAIMENLLWAFAYLEVRAILVMKPVRVPPPAPAPVTLPA